MRTLSNCYAVHSVDTLEIINPATAEVLDEANYTAPRFSCRC
jgi:hypothetical protein